MFYPHRLYSPRSGTAHRPFPTVRLGMISFAPVVSAMRNAAPPVLRTPRLKTSTNQRNRRERPMCRSARERTELLPIKTRHVPPYVIPTVAQAEWRNPPRGRKVPTQGKICYLGRFLDSVHSLARNDMIGGWFCFIRTGCIRHAAERHIGRSLQ